MRLDIVSYGETPNALRHNATAFRDALYDTVRDRLDMPLVGPVVMEVTPLCDDRRADTGLANVFGCLPIVFDVLTAANVLKDKRDVVQVIVKRWRVEARTGIHLHLSDVNEPF